VPVTIGMGHCPERENYSELHRPFVAPAGDAQKQSKEKHAISDYAEIGPGNRPNFSDEVVFQSSNYAVF